MTPEIPRILPSFLLYAPYLACLLRIYPHLWDTMGITCEELKYFNR